MNSPMIIHRFSLSFSTNTARIAMKMTLMSTSSTVLVALVMVIPTFWKSMAMALNKAMIHSPLSLKTE